MSAVYPRHDYRFPIIASWLLGPSSVTGHASGDQGLGSLNDIIFVAKLSRVRYYSDWGPNYSMASILASMNADALENRWHVNGEFPFLAYFRFTALMERMCNCGKIQNTVLTLILNVLIWISLLRWNSIQWRTRKVAVTCQRWIAGESLYLV